MTIYVTANLTITDPSWVEDYIPAVNALVEQHGGRYIARNTDITVVEGGGSAPNVSVIIEFPDQASADAWYNSDGYKPYLDARQAGSNGPVLMFEGL